MAMQATKQTKPVPVKRERGTGPVAVTYVDKTSKADHKRVPLDVTAVHFTANGHGAKSYNLHLLPAAVKEGLIAMAFATRAKTYVANHAKEDGSDALGLVDEIWGDLLAGQIYAKSESTKVGRKFDPTIYVQAWQNVYAVMASKNAKNKAGKPITKLTETQIADLRNQLETATPQERTARLKSWKENAHFTKELKKLQANAVDTSESDPNVMPF